MNHSSREQERNISIAIIAIVASLGSLGVVVAITIVTIPLQLQQAEAAGCGSAFPGLVHAFNASQGRCYHP
jgi:hypothetical protein